MNDSMWQKKMNRRSFLGYGATAALGLTTAGSVLAACGGTSGGGQASTSPTAKATPDGDMTYFGWSDYIDPKVLAGFEKEYGVKVKQSFYDSDETMIQKLASGLPYDLVITNSAYIPRMAEANLLQSIDHSQLRNFSMLTPFFRDPFYDPGATVSVPYGHSTCGVAWRTDKGLTTMTEGWNDLWDRAKEAKGKTYVLDSAEYALGASLVRLGYDHLSSDPAQLDEAAQQLIDLKPYLAGFSTDDINNLASGQAWLHQAWGCDAYFAASGLDNPDLIGYEVCKEGAFVGCDCMSVNANAKHPGTALLFMDWILDPAHSKANVEWIGQGNGTVAGEAAYDKLVADYPYLKEGSTAYLEDQGNWVVAATGERLRLWNTAWTKVKAG